MKSSLRGSSIVVTGLALISFALLVPNCQPSGGEEVGSGGSSGSNGGSGDGGNGGGKGGSGGSNSGGTTSAGGSSGGSGGSNSGGTTSSGGSNSGGTTAKGGSGGSNSGGTTTKGGSGGNGGGNGGSGGSNNGGTTSSGGTTSGNGGTTSNGGTTTSTGGTVTSGTKNSGTTVTFEKGKAVGAMTGYGWVALGSADTITDPTCGATKAAITSATPCAADTNWTGTGLCITGSCPALDATKPDYAANYGVVVGVNAGDAAGTGDASLVLGQAFTTIAIATTGLPTSEVRAQIHKKGDPDSTSYCLKYATGAMDLTKFATDCYATAPTGLFKAADIPNIDKISLEAVSASTAVTVTSMCMTGITFGK